MRMIERITSKLQGSEEQTYKYVCGDCDTEFESLEHNPNFTECPTCGGGRIYSTA